MDAARHLHAAMASLGCPTFLDRRDDPWARADRAAWCEGPRVVPPDVGRLVERLAGVPSPPGPAQVIHGDLNGNVLLSAQGPPSVIDVAPYWRTPSYAEGIVVADALCWHGCRSDVVDELGVSVDAVARGLLFRILTSVQLHENRPALLQQEVRRYERVVADLGL